MNTKVNEGKLISGKEAKAAWGGGERVEYYKKDRDEWFEIRGNTYVIVFDVMDRFRLKPRTITINEIEVPAPFEPKVGDVVWCISDDHGSGYCSYDWLENHSVVIGAWRTKEEIKQVVAALRQVFGGSHDN